MNRPLSDGAKDTIKEAGTHYPNWCQFVLTHLNVLVLPMSTWNLNHHAGAMFGVIKISSHLCPLVMVILHWWSTPMTLSEFEPIANHGLAWENSMLNDNNHLFAFNSELWSVLIVTLRVPLLTSGMPNGH